MKKLKRILLSICAVVLTMMSVSIISEQAIAVQIDIGNIQANTEYWQSSYKQRLNEWDKAPAVDPCLKKGTSIVVHTFMHRLFLCENNKMVSRHHVAIGRGGIDKRVEGDLKTPIGSYPLGLPRLSNDFAMFIPVAYPTPEQQRMGYTGGAIGIHGPYFRYVQLWGFLNILADWTQGCVAVGTDSEINLISSWVARFPKVSVHIFDERK